MEELKQIVEAAIMTSYEPIKLEKLVEVFRDYEEKPSKAKVKKVIAELQADCKTRGIELKEVASGFRYQVKSDYANWIHRLSEEKPPRYSKAFLETLVLIAYRQPITRGEIEEVRGVAVSANIIRTLIEHEWIRIVGHRDVPGKPSLLATTKKFLDYFNLKSLDELPTLAEVQDLDKIEEIISEELKEQGFEDAQMEIALDVSDDECEEEVEVSDSDIDDSIDQDESIEDDESQNKLATEN